MVVLSIAVIVLLSLLLILLVVGGFLFYFEAWQNRQPGRTVFVGSNLKALKTILPSLIEKYVDRPSDYTFVEPGAGLGEVSGFLSTYPWKGMRAVEIGRVLYWIGKYMTYLQKWPVTWVRGDVLAVEWPCPAVVYCYLFSEVTTKLYRSGKFKDSLVFVLTFPIDGPEPVETVAVSGWQGQLFVYDFRSSKKR